MNIFDIVLMAFLNEQYGEYFLYSASGIFEQVVW